MREALCKRCLTLATIDNDGKIVSRSVNCYWEGHTEKDYEPSRIWSIGHNLSGYMLESAPYVTQEFENAKDVCMHDIDSHVNSLWDGLTTGMDRIIDFDPDEINATQEVLDAWDDRAEELEAKGLILVDRDRETLVEAAEGEACLKELKELSDETEWYGTVGNVSYWINEVSRGDLDIPALMEGDTLDMALERINDANY